GRGQLTLNRLRERREAGRQRLRVVRRKLLRPRDSTVEAVLRSREAGYEVLLDGRAVLHVGRPGGLHVGDHLVGALLGVLEERDELLLDRLQVGARAQVGAQLVASGLEVVLPGLQRAAHGRRPLPRVRTRRARAAPPTAAAAGRPDGERGR